MSTAANINKNHPTHHEPLKIHSVGYSCRQTMQCADVAWWPRILLHPCTPADCNPSTHKKLGQPFVASRCPSLQQIQTQSPAQSRRWEVSFRRKQCAGEQTVGHLRTHAFVNFRVKVRRADISMLTWCRAWNWLWIGENCTHFEQKPPILQDLVVRIPPPCSRNTWTPLNPLTRPPSRVEMWLAP